MKKHLFIFLLFISLLGSAPAVKAQCAMCRRVVETSQDAKDNKAGRGLNSGILYLLAIPYLLGSVGAVVWWKNRKKF
jgi:hypothetical protein